MSTPFAPAPPRTSESEGSGGSGPQLRGTGLLDLKGFGKPPSFSGKQEDWSLWEWKFSSWCALLGAEEYMNAALLGDAFPSLAECTPEGRTVSKTLYHCFVQLLEGRAAQIARAAERGHGLHVWRKLKEEYEPSSASRLSSMLVGLLQPNFEKDTLVKIECWEQNLARYITDGGEPIPDSVKSAIFQKALPKNLQTVIRVAQLPDLAYKTVRKCVGDFIRAGVTYDQLGVSKTARDPDAMDIGFLGPPGSKKTGASNTLGADGKSKGKGATRKQGPQKEDICNNCGKAGHWARDCWAPASGAAASSSKPKGEGAHPNAKGKGKGKGKPGGKKGLHEVVPSEAEACEGEEINSLWLMSVETLSGEKCPEAICTVGGLSRKQLSWGEGRELLLLDSGAFDHCAPPDFGRQFPLKSCMGTEVVTANGSKLTVEGLRTVPFATVGVNGKPLTLHITFRVLAIRRPLLSVAKLAQQGYNVVFRGDGRGQISKGKVGVNMVLQGGMFYLPVSLPGWAADPGTLLDHTVAPLGPEDAEQEPPVLADPVADDPAEQEQGEEGADVARAP